jgi:hypothetical protein
MSKRIVVPACDSVFREKVLLLVLWWRGRVEVSRVNRKTEERSLAFFVFCGCVFLLAGALDVTKRTAHVSSACCPF